MYSQQYDGLLPHITRKSRFRCVFYIDFHSKPSSWRRVKFLNYLNSNHLSIFLNHIQILLLLGSINRTEQNNRFFHFLPHVRPFPRQTNTFEGKCVYFTVAPSSLPSHWRARVKKNHTQHPQLPTKRSLLHGAWNYSGATDGLENGTHNTHAQRQSKHSLPEGIFIHRTTTMCGQKGACIFPAWGAQIMQNTTTRLLLALIHHLFYYQNYTHTPTR